MVHKLKRRCLISAELVEMCSILTIELGFSVNETGKIIKRLCNEQSLSHLDFLKNINIENIHIETELDPADNERLNLLFGNMGKTDSESMLNLVESFRLNMIESRKRYEECYKNKSRLYIAFGIFGGLAVTLVLI